MKRRMGRYVFSVMFINHPVAEGHMFHLRQVRALSTVLHLNFQKCYRINMHQ